MCVCVLCAYVCSCAALPQPRSDDEAGDSGKQVSQPGCGAVAVQLKSSVAPFQYIQTVQACLKGPL